MVMLGLMLAAVLGGTGCEKDTDCKGDRVCETGKCVSPAVMAPELPAPPPPPPPQEEKRVPLGTGAPCRAPGDSGAPLGLPACPPASTSADSPIPPPLPPPQEEKRVPLGGPPQYRPPAAETCEQPLDVDGRLKPECRVTDSPKPVRSRKNRRAGAPAPDEEEPAARGVGLLGVMYGVLIGGGAAVPAFAFSGAGGVRFRSGIGFVGVAHGRIVVSSAGTIQMYGLGPGIRFGNRTQLTLALTGTFGLVNVGSIHAAGALFTLLAQIAIVIGDHFTLLAQPTIDFDASAVLGSITGGIGVTF